MLMPMLIQLLSSSSLVASLVDEDDDLSEESDPSVHFHSLLRLRRPATGVSGHESLSDSDESRFSPVRAPRGEFSSDESAGEVDCSDGEEGTLRDNDEVEAMDRDVVESCESEDTPASREDTVSMESMDASIS